MDNVADFAAFLGRDGALITRLVSFASGDLVSAEMIGETWVFYNERSGRGVAGNVQPAQVPLQHRGGTPMPMEYIGSSQPNPSKDEYKEQHRFLT